MSRTGRPGPTDASKLARFHRLGAGPFFPDVVATNRAYLAAALPDAPIGAGDRWVLTCLPTTGAGRRLSVVSMRNMETCVLHAEHDPEHDAEQDTDRDTETASVTGFVIVRRGAALSGFPTTEAIRTAFDLTEVAESRYRSAGDDQLRLAGSAASLRRALADPHIAEAARELADFLATGTTVYARFHNRYLTQEVTSSG